MLVVIETFLWRIITFLVREYIVLKKLLFLWTHAPSLERGSFLVEYFGEGPEGIPGCLPYNNSSFYGVGSESRDCHSYRTPPYYTSCDGFCTFGDARNNTYACLRTLDAQHNTMYCRYVDQTGQGIGGVLEFYDLSSDPYNSRNLASTLPERFVREMDMKLEELRTCQGSLSCNSIILSQEHWVTEVEWLNCSTFCDLR